MLKVSGLRAGYDGNPVLHGVDLEIAAGEIVTFIGANGAGKSTLVSTIAGLIKPMAGQILLEGEPIERYDAAARVRRGVVLVPEGRQVFAGLSVRENLRLGAYARRVAMSPSRLETKIAALCKRFPALAPRLAEPVGNLSGGQQQMLAIARGLMAEPRLLILDEPSLGLSPLLVNTVLGIIAGLRADGLSILLSEQNARSALQIADRGYVLESGKVVLSGRSRELLVTSDIADRYLGANAYRERDARRLGNSHRIRELVS